MRVSELIVASVLLSCVSAGARDFSGRVVRVSDGDTITEPSNLFPHWYSEKRSKSKQKGKTVNFGLLLM